MYKTQYFGKIFQIPALQTLISTDPNFILSQTQKMNWNTWTDCATWWCIEFLLTLSSLIIDYARSISLNGGGLGNKITRIQSCISEWHTQIICVRSSKILSMMPFELQQAGKIISNKLLLTKNCNQITYKIIELKVQKRDLEC